MTQPKMPNLPGFDAMVDTFEFVKNMWSGGHTASGIPGMTMPTLSQAEINKQIADLKAVESWLNVNMNMLRGTIQALEVQSATIAALNAMGATFATEMKSQPAASNATAATQNTASSAMHADIFPQNARSAADVNPLHANAGMDASTAWWNALQAQFNQVVGSVMAEESATKKNKAAPEKSVSKASSAKAKKTVTKPGSRAVKKQSAATPKRSRNPR